MALHDVETAEGSGEYEEFDEWLQVNKLSKVKVKLIENDISLDELAELGNEFNNDQLKNYAMNTLQLNIIDAKRFAKGVQNLSIEKQSLCQSQQQSVIHKVVRIIVSMEEEEAINNINKRQQIINEKMNTWINNINTLSNLAECNENEINILRKEFINILNKRMDALICRSNEEINRKKQLITDYVQELKIYNKSLIDADGTANTMLNKQNINKLERKNKIIKISKNVLTKNVNDLNVCIDIKVEIDRNKSIALLNGIGRIQCYQYPEKPVIAITHITQKSAKVEIKNIKQKYQCHLELNTNYKINDDEKKMEETWKQIACITDKNEYILNTLNENTTYGVRARYKNNIGFGEYGQITNFKTSEYIEKLTINITSSILTPTEIEKLLSLLLQNNRDFANKGWKIIYHGKRDGLTSTKCKALIDNKPNLICFIATNGGNVFGGYTAKGWKQGHAVWNRDDEAFIFGIRSAKNYEPTMSKIKADGADNAVCSYNGHYLVFGGGSVIYVHDNGNVYHNNPRSYTSLPTDRHFMGGKNCEKVVDVEVFELR